MFQMNLNQFVGILGRLSSKSLKCTQIDSPWQQHSANPLPQAADQDAAAGSSAKCSCWKEHLLSSSVSVLNQSPAHRRRHRGGRSLAYCVANDRKFKRMPLCESRAAPVGTTTETLTITKSCARLYSVVPGILVSFAALVLSCLARGHNFNAQLDKQLNPPVCLPLDLTHSAPIATSCLCVLRIPFTCCLPSLALPQNFTHLN